MTWSGRKVMTARAYWLPRLPVQCRRCGKAVVHNPALRSGGWHVGHVVDRALGGSDQVSNQWPEHDRCNTRAGGQLGAARTNARRIATTTAVQLDERARGIRGL